jgi:uncharacterized membrane protein YcaP (DUF421 family)
VWGALYGAAVLLAVSSVTVRVARRWRSAKWLLEGPPVVLARGGSYVRSAVQRYGLRIADLDAAINAQGGDRVTDTELVTLEPRGTLLVRLQHAEENASAGDIARLDAHLERIELHLAALVARPD